jgi:osmotically-inducible protein OsmY
VDTITDRLRVQPATLMGDRDIGDKVRGALLEEITLASCMIRLWDDGQFATMREPADAVGTSDVRAEDGVVTLAGEVAGLGQKRMAWRVPGARDVIDRIGVTPPEQDSDAAIADAVLQVREKDPFINSEKHPRARRAVVTLDGTVPREAEMKLAEDDAWYVFAVDKVVNRLEVRT